MDTTIEAIETVKTKEEITPKDAFKEMITGLLDLASGQKTPEEIQPNFPKWMPAIDKYIYKRDKEIEFNAGEVSTLNELESFAHGAPMLVYLKGGGGATRLLFKQTRDGFFLRTTDPQQSKTREKEVFGKLTALAEKTFSQNTTIKIKTLEDQIIFQR